MDEKHSVWVGSLSLNTKEDVLSDVFGKFGPVKSVVIVKDEQGKSKKFGYVNYYNREVAECAAHVMDGYELSNQTIKTKGPVELQKSRSESKSLSSGFGKKEYRMFTDCLFFIDGRECTWKSGQVYTCSVIIGLLHLISASHSHCLIPEGFHTKHFPYRGGGGVFPGGCKHFFKGGISKKISKGRLGTKGTEQF